MSWLAFMLVVFLVLRVTFQRDYYRGYFEQKQRNAGKDPETVLRNDLGAWVLRIFFS